jgi:hypothetical protein
MIQFKNKKIFIIMVLLVLMSVGYYLIFVVDNKVEVNSITKENITESIFKVNQNDCNINYISKNLKSSKEVLIKDIFWSNEYNTCFGVYYSVHNNILDWAEEYKEEYDVEILNYTYLLNDLNKDGESKRIITKSYHHKDLEEFLNNPDKTDKWDDDFDRIIDEYFIGSLKTFIPPDGLYEKITKNEFESGSIEIERLFNNEEFGFSGSASYSYQLEDGSWNVNSGIMEYKYFIMVDDKKGIYDDGFCEILFFFEKEYLQVEDNNRCGGLNVSFSGKYFYPNNYKFEWVYEEKYSNFKDRVLDYGWGIVIDQDSITEFGETYGFNCTGSGLDSFCSVQFELDGILKHVNVSKGERLDYEVWTVIGDQ